MNLQLVSISNGKFEDESRIYIVRVCVAVDIKESNVSMEIYVRISKIIPAVLILLLLCVMHLGLDGSCWLQYRIESTILMGLNETNTDFQPKASENTYIKNRTGTLVYNLGSQHMCFYGAVYICVCVCGCESYTLNFNRKSLAFQNILKDIQRIKMDVNRFTQQNRNGFSYKWLKHKYTQWKKNKYTHQSTVNSW